MNRFAGSLAVALAAAFSVCTLAYAQAPSGSTGQCKDGTYTSVEAKRGACSGHGGVKDWYGAAKTSADKEAKPGARADTASAAAKSEAASTKTQQAMRSEAAPGGGAGKVWLNTKSNVYHCTGDPWYGKTKAGEYMSEADAKAKGAHASHGKACA